MSVAGDTDQVSWWVELIVGGRMWIQSSREVWGKIPGLGRGSGQKWLSMVSGGWERLD